MTQLLHVIGSPRQAQSRSALIAGPLIDSWRASDPGLSVDTLDLWREPLPEFDGHYAAAKMAVITGVALDAQTQPAWHTIEQIVARFMAADAYLFTVPMWNGGIPYRLKHYIDLLMQPKLLFSFDPVSGYRGLLQGKRAATIYTSGVFEPGVPAAFGQDFHSTYLEWWLTAIGIRRIETVRYQPTLRTADPEQRLQQAINDARLAARRLASADATP